MSRSRVPRRTGAGAGQAMESGPSLTLAYGSLLALNTRRGGGPPESAPVSIA